MLFLLEKKLFSHCYKTEEKTFLAK
jgi:hypothetical protein